VVLCSMTCISVHGYQCFICLQLECLQERIKPCARIQEIILDALIDAGDADTLHWWPYSVTYFVVRDTVGYNSRSTL